MGMTCPPNPKRPNKEVGKDKSQQRHTGVYREIVDKQQKKGLSLKLQLNVLAGHNFWKRRGVWVFQGTEKSSWHLNWSSFIGSKGMRAAPLQKS